jgi:oxygen-independent coproporphyrinogen-3 oxidase
MPTTGILPAQAFIGSDERSFHAYVHVPFCRVRCGYCDFNTYTSSELRGVSQASFAQVLMSEISFSRRLLETENRDLGSVFFGGGTPTQLPVADLVEILGSLKDAFGFAQNAEITTEANPDNVDLEYLQALKDGGFTRVSFGMQSAVDSVLKVLDRTHTPAKIPQVVAWAKQVGLQVSVDLIYGAPTETVEQWKESLEAAIAMSPDHISAYSLIVEPGTKLARQIKSGELPEPDEDEQAEKYELADALLSAAGFHWYEVSNWSRSEATQSKHNLAYWNSNDWWGYGPGAHSHFGGVRWWNVKHPATYSQALAKNESPGAGFEELDAQTQLIEQVLLLIRLSTGISIDNLKRLETFKPATIANFLAQELIEPMAAFRGQLVLTLKGRLLADLLVRELT